MHYANLIWWAITGLLLSLLIGILGAILATGNGNSTPGSIMIGATAAGAFAGLWITATLVVQEALRP
ncbi:hypothetical protein ABGB17_07005 [Sphaerisporangium sp. B11E5]|uniref:hypothetical protein n=1 Tax=Sphaerisporangium sp. B11E5 TaxID=3153563 RepID=UPI00325D3B9B